jgi:nicotine blue oxidoreductase
MGVSTTSMEPEVGQRAARVAAVILAAGAGTRFGQAKAGVEVGGRRLVDLAIESCVRAGLSPVVVVLGAARLTPLPPVAGTAAERAVVRVVDNPDWATGLASSLRTGLAALEPDPEVGAAVVTLVDTPGVGAVHLRRIRSSLSEGATAVVATYRGELRTPVGLTREVWAEVAESAVGDEGARHWLRSHPHLVTEVECADLGPWTDIDTPGDLPG